MAKAAKRPTKKMATPTKNSLKAAKSSKQLGQKITRTAKPTRKEIRQEVPRRPATGK